MAYGEFFKCEACGCGREVRRILGWSDSVQQRNQIPKGWDNLRGIGWICGPCISDAFKITKLPERGAGAYASNGEDSKFGTDWKEEESD